MFSVLLCIGSSPGDYIYKEWEVVSAWGKKGIKDAKRDDKEFGVSELVNLNIT